jgi:hypothetical protein
MVHGAAQNTGDVGGASTRFEVRRRAAQGSSSRCGRGIERERE